MFILTKGGTTVTLRNPDSGDVRRVTLSDIRRFMRSGTPRCAIDVDHWTQYNNYVYKFSALTNILHVPADPDTDYVIDQLKDFLITNAGLEITITDHLGDARTGYIYTPINEIIHARPDCTFNVGFEFLEKPT